MVSQTKDKTGHKKSKTFPEITKAMATQFSKQLQYEKISHDV